MKQILAVSVERKNSVCVFESDEEHSDAVEYVACAGAGIVSAPVNKSLSSHQRFFFEPPSVPAITQIRSPQSSPDSPNSKSSKLMRVNRTSCVTAHPRSHLFASGEEIGYMPRLVLYDSLTTDFLDSAINVHEFGVNYVKFSPSGNLLASLGSPQDGFLHIWDVSERKLTPSCSNKCVSDINDLIWLNDYQLLTIGVRHLKVWTIEGNVLSGRNIVLGSLIDQTFTSAIPLNSSEEEQLKLLVGTTKGCVYEIPGAKLVTSDPQRQINDMAIIKDTLLVSTSSTIFKYQISGEMEAILEAELSSGARGLYTALDHFYILSEEGNIEPLGAPIPSTVNNSIKMLINRKGLNLSSSGSDDTTLAYTTDSRSVLQWPSNVIAIPLDDISTADCSNNTVLAGSLSGDIYLHDRIHNAHNGPVTDTHIIGNVAVSAARDRFVQIWVRHTEDKDWKLKQTLNFPSPVLRLRLVLNKENALGLLCCCLNKTVYTYTTREPVDIEDESKPAFASAPQSLLVKGMPFSISTINEFVALSCNDKMVHLIDPWRDERIVASWRAYDSNSDSVNLVHIQCIDHNGSNLLIGSSSNKAAVLYNLFTGELLACQYGYGESISGIAWTGNELLVASNNLYLSELVKNTSSNTTKPSGFPDLKFPRSPPPRISSPPPSPSPPRSPNPERKIFVSPSSRSRSISPARSPNAAPPTSRTRSPSPPPRIQRPSIANHRERGRPILTKGPDNPTLSLPHNAPQPTLRPDTLSSQTNSASGNTQEDLVKALKSFLRSDEKGDEELKELLVSALNKVDGFALVNLFGDKLLDLVKSHFDTNS